MHQPTSVGTPSDHSAPLIEPRYLAAFVIVTSLFFLWAIPNNLNDVLIRQFMKSFELTRFQGGLVQSAFYVGYFVFSLPAAIILRRFGYRIGLVAGLCTYALGCLLFWPAAEANKYIYFLGALFVIAAGLAFLETGAGAFVVQLGNSASSERRLNLAQAFNPPGTIAGALIGTIFIFSGVEPAPEKVASMKAAGTYAAFLQTETLRVVMPYLILAVIVLGFAVLLAFTRFPPSTTVHHDEPADSNGSFKKLIRHRHFLLAVVSQFFYMGAQVGTWSFLIQYAAEYAHMAEKTAGYLLSVSLVLFAIGRFLATALMNRIAANRLMGIFALINVVLVIIAMLAPGQIGLGALMLSSLFMSLMYPTNYALGLKGLSSETTIGASILVMAIIGGAVFAPLMGWVAETAGSMAVGFSVVLVCYLVVAHYGFRGSKQREMILG